MKDLCKRLLLVVSVIMANAVAMIPDIGDATSAKKMLQAATTNLRSANSELQKVEDSRMRLEIDYDTKSKNWKRDIKSVSDRLVSQLKLVSTVDRQAVRQAVVVEALQKIVLLHTQIETLRKTIDEQSIKNQALQKLSDQLEKQQQAARDVEARLALENTALINRLNSNQTLTKEEIERLNKNIGLLTSRLESNRARADQNWLELEKLKSSQEKSTSANPITRFFNWVRGRKQQRNQ